MIRKLIVGLGNPGEKYVKTRHNLGARVVRQWKEQYPDADVLLPQNGVYMNDFGTLIPKNREIIIVHDDIELPLGEMRLAEDGSAKGHNGVRSVHATLGTTDIPRLRLGLGRPPEGLEVDEFVLEKFTPEEEEIVARVVEKALQAITDYVLPSGEAESSAS